MIKLISSSLPSVIIVLLICVLDVFVALPMYGNASSNSAQQNDNSDSFNPYQSLTKFLFGLTKLHEAHNMIAKFYSTSLNSDDEKAEEMKNQIIDCMDDENNNDGSPMKDNFHLDFVDITPGLSSLQELTKKKSLKASHQKHFKNVKTSSAFSQAFVRVYNDWCVNQDIQKKLKHIQSLDEHNDDDSEWFAVMSIFFDMLHHFSKVQLMLLNLDEFALQYFRVFDSEDSLKIANKHLRSYTKFSNSIRYDVIFPRIIALYLQLDQIQDVVMYTTIMNKIDEKLLLSLGHKPKELFAKEVSQSLVNIMKEHKKLSHKNLIIQIKDNLNAVNVSFTILFKHWLHTLKGVSSISDDHQLQQTLNDQSNKEIPFHNDVLQSTLSWCLFLKKIRLLNQLPPQPNCRSKLMKELEKTLKTIFEKFKNHLYQVSEYDQLYIEQTFVLIYESYLSIAQNLTQQFQSCQLNNEIAKKSSDVINESSSVVINDSIAPELIHCCQTAWFYLGSAEEFLNILRLNRFELKVHNSRIVVDKLGGLPSFIESIQSKLAEYHLLLSLPSEDTNKGKAKQTTTTTEKKQGLNPSEATNANPTKESPVVECAQTDYDSKMPVPPCTGTDQSVPSSAQTDNDSKMPVSSCKETDQSVPSSAQTDNDSKMPVPSCKETGQSVPSRTKSGKKSKWWRKNWYRFNRSKNNFPNTGSNQNRASWMLPRFAPTLHSLANFPLHESHFIPPYYVLLNNEIREFMSQYSAANNGILKNWQVTIIENLNALVKQFYINSIPIFQLYGSSSTNTHLIPPFSDFNLNIMYEEDANSLITKLFCILQFNCGTFISAQSSQYNSLPSPSSSSKWHCPYLHEGNGLSPSILTFSDKSLPSQTLEINVTINQLGVLNNAEAIRNFDSHYPLFRPLLLVLKFFLLTYELSSACFGGIPSCALQQLVMFHVKNHAEQRSGANGADNLSMSGHCLISFFDFFGNTFKPMEYCIVGDTIQPRHNFQFAWGHPLCVLDSFDLSNNLGSNAFKFDVAQAMFRNALTILHQFHGDGLRRVLHF